MVTKTCKPQIRGAANQSIEAALNNDITKNHTGTHGHLSLSWVWGSSGGYGTHPLWGCPKTALTWKLRAAAEGQVENGQNQIYHLITVKDISFKTFFLLAFTCL